MFEAVRFILTNIVLCVLVLPPSVSEESELIMSTVLNMIVTIHFRELKFVSLVFRIMIYETKKFCLMHKNDCS